MSHSDTLCDWSSHMPRIVHHHWEGSPPGYSGIQGTKAGELTLLCPVCPQPGINLPPGWELTPEAQRCNICYSTALLCWHDFQIFICPFPWVRCKFLHEKEEGVQQWVRSKLKRRMELFCWGGTLQGTPEEALGSKAGHMPALSLIHLGSLTRAIHQHSDCVNHDTVNKPDQESWGLAATGVFTIDCAHHNFKWPNGIRDIQR